MKVVFTQHATDRMRERDISRTDVMRLLDTVEQVANSSEWLSNSSKVLLVERASGRDTFIVKSGRMRAVVAIDPTTKDQVVVMSVFHAENDGSDSFTRDTIGHRARA